MIPGGCFADLSPAGACSRSPDRTAGTPKHLVRGVGDPRDPKGGGLGERSRRICNPLILNAIILDQIFVMPDSGVFRAGS